MKSILITVFGVFSLAIGFVFLLRALQMYKDGKRTKRVLSATHVYTIGVFISVVLVFIPLYYTSYDFGDEFYIFRPLLIAVHNALRIFILDCDFDFIVKSLENENIVLRVCFSLYTAFLYVIAPVLTFSNVLSLFKNLKGEARYKWHRYKKHYIMSELNEKSIVLAKSIYKTDRNAVIVFANVFQRNEEDEYEILTQARDINAICLKKDISHLDFTSKKGDVEIFLISNNESENVNRAVKITNELNENNSKHNVKVFVFSTKPSAAYIIDSIKYDNLLQHASKYDYNENCFKLRRINEKQQLIRKTIPEMNLFDIANRHRKTLSVLIVGFGSYGTEFFKTLVWYCQFEGYKLQINIVDKLGKRPEEKDYIESLIKRDCPELLKKNRDISDGDAQYDIEIFSDIDMLTSDFAELLLSDEKESDKAYIAERLKSTNFVFVSLGDDDINIEVAIHLRRLFDRVNGIQAKKDIAWQDEAVDIYSVVYDDQKSGILYNEQSSDNVSHILTNHRDVPYHIHFIGGISSQFDYRNIYDADLEKCAYEHHRSWVNVEELIYNEWLAVGDKTNLEGHDWFFGGEKTAEAAARARKKYEQYEYYRLSSIAKEMYQREIKSNEILLSETLCLEGGKKQTCNCKNCIRRKKSEHMRWNAYTRVAGYTYKNGVRADRALLHDNLCSWELLSELDRQKD